MKRYYTYPMIEIHPLCSLTVLCASPNDSVTSNVNVHGGDQSGDVQNAF